MRLFYAFFYSLSGLNQAFKCEASFRLEVYGLIVMVFLLYVLDYPLLESLLMASAYVLVMIVELLNTGLEKVVDRFSTEKHPLSKMVKDVGSAAVFISMCLCGVVWGCIVYSHLIRG